jgi:hypothetical protein
MNQPPETPDSNAQTPDPNGRPGLYTIVTYDGTGEVTYTSSDQPPRPVVQLPDGTRLPLDDYLANRHLYPPECAEGDLPDLGLPGNGDDGTP